MSFVESRFPTDIAYGSSGGPEYSTDIIANFGGYEQRNSNWAAARARYNVAHGIKTKAQLDELIAFFRARKGRAIGFRFKDWLDYKGVGENIGTGNGSNKIFQIVKNYSSGSATESRKITKLVSGTVKIYLAGTEQSSGLSVNNNSGVVTFTTAPSNGSAVTADFEFDVPVRFDIDQLSASLDDYSVHSWSNISLVEIRV